MPAVYGHEAAGIVTGPGDGVSDARIGQRVLVTLIRACGTCRCCSDGRPVICEYAADSASPLALPDGTPVTQGMKTGAFAEKLVVDASQLAPLPADIALDMAALLACGVITGTGAVFKTAAMPAVAAALVIGTGGVGLNTIQGACIAGAGRNIAMDVAPEKLQAARDFGATDGVLASDPDAQAQIRAPTAGRGGGSCLCHYGRRGRLGTGAGTVRAGRVDHHGGHDRQLR